jgi:hypothetical protein
MVPPCDFHVMSYERADALTHFVLTELVLVVVHFCLFGFLGLLRKIES